MTRTCPLPVIPHERALLLATHTCRQFSSAAARRFSAQQQPQRMPTAQHRHRVGKVVAAVRKVEQQAEPRQERVDVLRASDSEDVRGEVEAARDEYEGIASACGTALIVLYVLPALMLVVLAARDLCRREGWQKVEEMVSDHSPKIQSQPPHSLDRDVSQSQRARGFALAAKTGLTRHTVGPVLAAIARHARRGRPDSAK